MGFFFFLLENHFSTHSLKNTLEQKKTILSIKKQPKTQNQTSEKLFLQ